MDKYVTSRPLAEKLKAAGYPQDTLNVYERTAGLPKQEWYLIRPLFAAGMWGTQEVKERMAAPLTDELLEQLPEQVHDHRGIPGIDHFALMKNADCYEAAYGIAEVYKTGKPVDALARLWLWCKANGYIDGDS